MPIHRFAAIAATGLCACAQSSPLDQIPAQVEVNVDPTVQTRARFELMIETWNNLSALEDAVTNDQLTVTLDGSPLVLDPVGTAELGQGDEYIAAYMLPNTTLLSAPAPTTSRLAITDGATTWEVQIANLFATDLAPTQPLVAGDNTLEWPSAVPSGELSTIYWACVEIVGASSMCGGYELPASPVVISQQYISANIAANAGDRVVVTAEREVAPRSTGPAFITKIRNRYEQTLAP